MKIEFLETIKTLDGQALHLDYHQKRYESVLNDYGVERKQSLASLIDPPKEGVYRCRIVYTVDGVISVSYHPYKKRQSKRLKLIQAEKLDYAKKYADRRELDALFRKRDECDDVLIVQKSLIKDTTIANIAFLKDGVWFTPKEPLLKGTTRARLLKDGLLQEAEIRVENLCEYEAIALMNAMIDFDIIQNKRVEEVIC